MEFNRYIWNLYRQSPEGQAAIKRDLADHYRAMWPDEEETPFRVLLHYQEIQGEAFIEGGLSRYEEDNLRTLIAEYARTLTVNDSTTADLAFTSIAEEGLSSFYEDEGKSMAMSFGGSATGKDRYDDVYAYIDGLSAGLHDVFPEFYVPYFFDAKFDAFSGICRLFDIRLPQLPGKQQKRERALYYLGVSRALQGFRAQHGLTPPEMNAFLYDFAPRNLPLRSQGELPSPSRVWFVIGGVASSADFDFLDGANDESVGRWHGNLEARRGDIVLMWCALPRSYLHSVWRVLDDGFNDPFFYHYATIRVGQPVKVPPIRFAELAQHPLFADKPAVRAHLQGASGTAFSVEEYGAICDLLRAKGFDVSQLPPPPAAEEYGGAPLATERDVETALVEPLLQRLGFAEADWVRQLPIRMGRGERYYPDYALGADATHGEEAAAATIECKLDIETERELRDAFVQAKSYALRLQAGVLALAARRGLWVYRRRDDGFSPDHFVFKTWRELAHPDILHEISLILGKRAIETAVTQRSRRSRARQQQ